MKPRCVTWAFDQLAACRRGDLNSRPLQLGAPGAAHVPPSDKRSFAGGRVRRAGRAVFGSGTVPQLVSRINVPSARVATGFGTVRAMGHLLGYARVSTIGQEPALQLDALEAAGCYRVFTDRVSGTADRRPQLDALLDQLRPGDTLVVWRLDRLGRSLRHLIDTTVRLEERGVGFRSLAEHIDTTTPTGKLVFHVFGALAEFERDLIVERTRSGLVAARARGRTGGRPAVMTPAKVEGARRMYAGREHTLAEIAATIGVGRSTVYRHLGEMAGVGGGRPTETTGRGSTPRRASGSQGRPARARP